MTQKFNYPTWNILGLDKRAPAPLHEQLYTQICKSIADGRIERGARLPPSRKLADELEVSRNTVNHAYMRLFAEGYVTRRQGAGVYVAAVLPEEFLVRQAQTKPSGADIDHLMLSGRGRELISQMQPRARIEGFALSPGLPAFDLFPYRLFGRIAGRNLTYRSLSGAERPAEARTEELNVQIATYLLEARGVRCDPSQVITVGSVLQAMTLVSQVVLDSGDHVVAESPSYTTELATFKAAGARLILASTDNHGILVDEIEGQIAKSEFSPRLVKVTPIGQFPSASCMTLERKLKLLEWANKRNLWIFEDDFNSEIRWAGKATPTLSALDAESRVIYVSSFNRVLVPSLQLAYLVVPPELVEAFKTVQRALSLYASPTHEHLVARFMASGHLASHIRKMRTVYRDRSALLIDNLRAVLPQDYVVPDLDVGLHLAIECPGSLDDRAVSDALLKQKIDIAALSTYYLAEPRKPGFVVGFGNTPEEQIPVAVRKFAKLVSEVHAQARSKT